MKFQPNRALVKNSKVMGYPLNGLQINLEVVVHDTLLDKDYSIYLVYVDSRSGEYVNEKEKYEILEVKDGLTGVNVKLTYDQKEYLKNQTFAIAYKDIAIHRSQREQEMAYHNERTSHEAS